MEAIRRSLIIMLIASFVLTVACESDAIPDEQIEHEGIVAQLRAKGLENIVIPHRIDDFERMKMVQQMGFTGWELDLVFYTDSNKTYFSVKHNQDSTQVPSFEEYLEKIDFKWVRMAQIWESKVDELCEKMEVMKLQKVVFAGFLVDKKQGEVL